MSRQSLRAKGSRALLLIASMAAAPLAAQTSAPPTYPGVPIPNPFTPGGGSGDVPAYVEYDKRLRASEQLSALGSELFGDEVSLYTGQTSFRQVDIDIPGNNALPVQLSRRYTISTLVGDQFFDQRGGPGNPYGGMANWDIEVPYVYGIFDSNFRWNIPLGATTQQPRCSQYFPPRVSGGMDPTEIWSGNKVVIPGKGEKELLRLDTSYPPLQYPNDGRSPTWTTSDFDAFRCITLSGPQDEGFVMTSRDGTSYRFDVYVERDFPTVRVATLTNARKAVYLLASEVTDRYGNWVRYAYNGNGHPTAITASDGRAITLTYYPSPNQNRLQSASVTLSVPSETRTWTYAYANQAPDGLPRLTTVTLPDNVSTWQFDYAALNSPNYYLYVTYLPPKPSGKECLPPEISTPGGDFGLHITHPSGAKGEFRFKLERTDRSNLPNPNCQPQAGGGKYLVTPYIDAFRLKSKKIFDTDASSSTWDYTYGAIPNDRSRTTITQPDGSTVLNDFSSAYGAILFGAPAGLAIEGQLLVTTAIQDGIALRTQTNTYVTGPDTAFGPLAGYPFPSRYGGGGAGDDGASGSIRPLLSSTIDQQGVRFTRANQSFDALARPLEVKRESKTVGGIALYAKTETTTYDDKRPIWVLGLVNTVTDSTQPSSPVVDNDYDSVGNLMRVTAFNREQRTMTWRGDGTLQTVKVGPNTTTLGVPKRGIPQSVTYADTTSISAIIDDAGDIRSVTDENGFSTSYGYDALRRLKRIDYPAGDTVNWAPTELVYERVGTDPVSGITGIHWRQTTSTGNARKVVHYDQRLRPRLTTEYDTANASGTQRYVRRGFDYASRETFVSFPSAVSGAAEGTRTFYDALGRATDTAQDSELGALATHTRYIAPFTTQFENARGKITSTTFQSFDEPDTSAPMTISEPMAVTTTFTRDVFGKPLTLARSGMYNGSPVSQTRQYVYGPDQLLCKTIEAESGTTVLNYNTSNLVEWKASGQSLTSTTDCQRGSVGAAEKVSYDYDQRDRLWRTRYGDGSPSVVIGFTPDGLPESVQSDNSTWTTLYNKRRLMTSETLNLSGVNYPLSYTLTSNGHIASLTYPDNAIVAYAPNALGEATQVGNYASSITRHPNGALKNLTYGNGIVHTTEQNLRGLPSRSHDAGVLDDRYVYDENANVKSITDAQLAAFTRTMDYDDRDRLTGATNTTQWHGTHSFVYDPLDNLRRSNNPDFGDWTYVYNATTRRLDRIDPTTGGAAILTYGYDARGRATARALIGTSQTFGVDLADRVTSVGPSFATYRYDGLGHRTSVTKAGTTTVQVYSQAGQLMYQSSPASNGIFRSGFQSSDTPYPALSGGNKRYVYLGRHLVAEDGTAGRSYVHTDGLGSPVRTTDASGAPSAREDYKPYGWGAEPLSKPGFTGHVTDAETGLSYMQARYYDPYAGRFLAVDPVASSSGSFNRYWYARNNPYVFTDPDGRQAFAGWAENQIHVSSASVGQFASMAADFTPVVGDIKGGIEAIQNPTTANVAAAIVGVVPLVGDGAAKAIKVGTNIAENASKGAKAEAKIVGELGDQVAGQRVTLESSTTGKRSVTDIVEKDKTVHEVKSGDAKLSPGQQAVKADIDAGKPVIPRGANAKKALLEPGKATIMKCYKVDRC